MALMLEQVNGRQHWIINHTLIGAGESILIDLPFEPKGYSVQITPTGFATVYASIDNINFEQWPLGAVSTSSIQGIMFPIRQIKVTNTTSTSTDICIWGY